MVGKFVCIPFIGLTQVQIGKFRCAVCEAAFQTAAIDPFVAGPVVLENVGKAPADAGRETFRAEILGGVAQFMEEIKSLFIVRAGRQPLDVEKTTFFSGSNRPLAWSYPAGISKVKVRHRPVSSQNTSKYRRKSSISVPCSCYL